MPLIIGDFTPSATSLREVPLLGPEFPDEQLECIDHKLFSVKAWRPRNLEPSDLLFQGEFAYGFMGCALDGEIVNREELHQQAHRLGLAVEAHRAGLAELVAYLVGRLGANAFALLRGAFSCAVISEKCCYLAVDRFGMKRLIYSAGQHHLRFSSRVHRFLAPTGGISLRALAYYLNFAFVPSPECALENMQKLQPGNVLIWQPGERPHLQRYWEMRFTEDLYEPEEALASRFRELLRESVQVNLHDVSDARAGCYLSGGTDSSSIVGMTGQVLPKPLSSYTIAFEKEDFNELRYAKLAASHFGSNLSVFTMRAEDAFAAIPKLVKGFDEPFGNPSALGGYHCARSARERGIELMLAGDGGDELFGGNERYAKDVIYSCLNMLPRFVVDNPVLNALFAVTGTSSQSIRLKNILRRAMMKNPERFYLEDCLGDLNGDFLTSELSKTVHDRAPLEIMREYYEAAPAHSELNRLLFIDLKLTIGDNDLVKVRQTAASAGMRVRYPMLDHAVAEFSGRLPAQLKVKGLQKRYLFKKALTGFLPDEVIHKKKHGFGIPVGAWFRTDPQFRELLLDVTCDRVTLQRGYFRKDRLQAIVDEHLRSLRDWGQTLWALVMLELWQREYERA